MIKVLHTADWHLGKRLEQCERTDEHQHFLDWLIDEIEKQKVDVLIVSGDIFDSGTPSNTALKQYYNFLWRLNSTCCREAIIIGGNHDSVTTLQAPKDLLRIFNVHVVGGVPDDVDEQIIKIKNKQEQIELVVCAIPFLRDKDVRLSVAGETPSELEQRLKQGICAHYNQFKELVKCYKDKGIPVIATGHLFAQGATNSDSEKDIHVGNLGQICGDQFPVEFDYVALGHIHRPQIVNKQEHIQYSGSPIPLSFSEADDKKIVVLIEFEKNDKKFTAINIPPCRKLFRVKGDIESIKTSIEILQDQLLKYPSWLEVQVDTEKMIHDLEEQVRKLIEHKPFIDQIFTRQNSTRAKKNLDEQVEEVATLQDLDERKVFEKKCEAAYPESDHSDLMQTFDEAMELFRAEKN